MRTFRSLALVVVAALCLAVGGFGWWQYIDATTSSAAANHAVVDEKATSAVQSEVSQALERVLTYDHADPQTTKAAADRVLSGAARTEYDTLFADLQKQAPGQKLVLTAQVQAVGVKELTDRHAELLVFIDQSSRRAGEDQASVSAAQLAITARKSGGSWKITELKPL